MKYLINTFNLIIILFSCKTILFNLIDDFLISFHKFVTPSF